MTAQLTREQFAAQAPYYPGTFWLVDSHIYRIDDAGRPVDIGTGHRPQLCWLGCDHAHDVARLQLVRA